MAAIETAMSVLHLLFAGLWAGAVVFVTVSVLPLARDGDLAPEALETVAGRLRTLSRASAAVLFATGGHLAGTRYTVATLLGTGRGRLVLAMVALWLALAGLVEVGAAQLTDGTERGKVRAPARKATTLHRVAALVAVVLLILGGLLSV